MNRLLLITFIIQLFLLNAIALDCPNIRLDKDFENNQPKNLAKYKTMQSIPVKSQKLGTCYAYSATHMIDAIKAKRLLERGIKPTSNNLNTSSPLFTAVTTESAWSVEHIRYDKNGNPKFPFEGGYVCDAFNSIKELGSCSEKDMDDIIKKSKLDEKTFFKKLLSIENKINEKMKEVMKEYNSIKFSKYNPNNDTIDKLSFEYKEAAASTYLQNMSKEIIICKNDVVSEIYHELKSIFKDQFKVSKTLFQKYFNPELFASPLQLSAIFKMICHNREKVNTNSKCSNYSTINAAMSLSKYPFVEKIISELKEDSLPVGISYCSKIFNKGPDYIGIKSRIPLKFDQSEGENTCARHASVVIGSRFNPKSKSCELLIRNTWGTGCNKEHYPSKQTLKNKGGEFSQFDVKCENGNYWIDYKTIDNNTYSVHHL